MQDSFACRGESGFLEAGNVQHPGATCSDPGDFAVYRRLKWAWLQLSAKGGKSKEGRVQNQLVFSKCGRWFFSQHEFQVSERGTVFCKGVGEVRTCLLEGKKP
jgi:hypothetical protein